ncbi:MAG: hypothetical protein VKK32_00805 [Candidatus Melainabacteria bacterium]|nr:hypothetical protein [Candidatus Melainabacteria bacterium]
MVDNIPTFPNLIDLSEWRDRKALSTSRNTGSSPDSSDDQHLQKIAQGIFNRMTQAAKALVKNDSPGNVQKLQQAADFLLSLEIPLADKIKIFNHLDHLSPKRSELIHSGSDWMDPNQQVKLHIVNNLLALQRKLKSPSSPD